MTDKQKTMRNRIIGSIILAVISVILEITVSDKFEYIMLAAYILVGYDVLFQALKNFRKLIDESFLMTIATIGAISLGQFSEALAVMLFYQVGELFTSVAVGRSRNSISELMSIKADEANLIDGDSVKSVMCEDVGVGDCILVKTGEKIPIDGIIYEGRADVDTSAITGESVLRELSEGDEAISGCVNINGVLKIRTTKSFENSTVSRILEMVENASSKKADAEKFITKFARVYTPIVVILALIIAFVPWIFTDTTILEWIRRALIFLVVSCPCALVISVPLGFFGAIGGASRSGILIKGSNYIENLSRLSCVVFDKTGTLTKGKPEISAVYPENVSEHDLLFTAAIAQKNSNHPLASAIKAKAENIPEGTDYLQSGGLGVSCMFNGKAILCGNMRMMLENNIIVDKEYEGTVVYTACDGQYIGAITFSDKVKENAADAIKALKNVGVKKTVMLTGDNESSAMSVAKAIGIDEVHAGLLPDGKVEMFEKLMDNNVIAFVGDGINDAPVLARADIGIAMGGMGSDAAIEACDMVIMNDDLNLIAKSIKISRKTMKIVWQNIIFALGVKILVMVLGALGYSNMWQAVFADVGVAILAIMNSMRMLKV